MKSVFLIALLLSNPIHPFFTSQPTKTEIAVNGTTAAFVGICSGGAAALLLPVTNHYPALRQNPVSYAALLAVLFYSHYQLARKAIGEGYNDFSTWIASGTFIITAFIVMVKGE